MERLATVSLGGEDRAYPFRLLRELRVVQDRAGGKDIVLFFSEGTASAVDQGALGTSRDVGSVGVFRPEADGRALRFAWEAGRIRDRETHSVWDISGLAVEGPLKGRRLTALPHGTPFAFAWLAFKPGTILFTPKS